MRLKMGKSGNRLRLEALQGEAIACWEDAGLVSCSTARPAANNTRRAASKAIDAAAAGRCATVQDMWRAALSSPTEAGSCARVSHWRSRPAASSGVGP